MHAFCEHRTNCMQRSLETCLMSRRSRNRIVGGKVLWEREMEIWSDEMVWDCIALGVTVLATRHQVCG